jgi:4-amino-4-deoxy-L-arabinose transferase-like glycosyltransferase
MTSGRAVGFLKVEGVVRALSRWPAATLFALCLIAWLPGFLTLPPLDRDESRFAQASKQMVESGDLVDIRFSTGARYNKPIGIYWLQSASEKVFGSVPHNIILHYRIPSLIGGYLALLLTFWCARGFVGPPTALLSAALLGATVLMTAEAEIATTDAVLLATILAAQAIFMRVYLVARDPAYPKVPLWLALLGWAAIGAGILIKGPVILGVLAVTVIPLSVWDREWRWLGGTRPLPGIPLAILIVAPWAIAIGFASHGAFYQQSLGHDFANKMIGGQESHGALPGYFLVLSSLTLWPATLVALPGLYEGYRSRHEPAFRYLFVWAVASWLLFEIVPTKLPHYVLPAYPALTMLGAMWVMRPSLIDALMRERIFRYAASAQFAVGAIVLAAAPFVAAHKFGTDLSPWIVVCILLFGLLALAATIMWVPRRRLIGSLLAIAGALVLFPTLTLGLAPALSPIWTSPRAAALIARDSKADDPPVTLAGYVEPSLVFLLGTRTNIETGQGAADIAAGQGGLVLVEDHELKNFLDRVAARGAAFAKADEISGYDYSRGRAVHLTLYRTLPAMQVSPPPAE